MLELTWQTTEVGLLSPQMAAVELVPKLNCLFSRCLFDMQTGLGSIFVLLEDSRDIFLGTHLNAIRISC